MALASRQGGSRSSPLSRAGPTSSRFPWLRCQDSTVVALISTTQYTEDYDVTAALFGRRENISDQPDVVEIARRRNGYWRPPPMSRGARVSGVLFGQRLNHWTVASAYPKLWVNPWANGTLDYTDPFSVLTRSPDASGHIQETQGTGDSSIFGLPSSWPN